MYDKKIAGVCSGFARYLDMDVTVVRIVFLILAFTTGAGFIGYIVGWIAMPREDAPPVAVVQPTAT
jgi:phage shock protein PspC (stress-responsive transcriptional regulator)